MRLRASITAAHILRLAFPLIFFVVAPITTQLRIASASGLAIVEVTDVSSNFTVKGISEFQYGTNNQSPIYALFNALEFGVSKCPFQSDNSSNCFILGDNRSSGRMFNFFRKHNDAWNGVGHNINISLERYGISGCISHIRGEYRSSWRSTLLKTSHFLGYCESGTLSLSHRRFCYFCRLASGFGEFFVCFNQSVCLAASGTHFSQLPVKNNCTNDSSAKSHNQEGDRYPFSKTLSAILSAIFLAICFALAGIGVYKSSDMGGKAIIFLFGSLLAAIPCEFLFFFGVLGWWI